MSSINFFTAKKKAVDLYGRNEAHCRPSRLTSRLSFLPCESSPKTWPQNQIGLARHDHPKAETKVSVLRNRFEKAKNVLPPLATVQPLGSPVVRNATATEDSLQPRRSFGAAEINERLRNESHNFPRDITFVVVRSCQNLRLWRVTSRKSYITKSLFAGAGSDVGNVERDERPLVSATGYTRYVENVTGCRTTRAVKKDVAWNRLVTKPVTLPSSNLHV